MIFYEPDRNCPTWNDLMLNATFICLIRGQRKSKFEGKRKIVFLSSNRWVRIWFLTAFFFWIRRWLPSFRGSEKPARVLKVCINWSWIVFKELIKIIKRFISFALHPISNLRQSRIKGAKRRKPLRRRLIERFNEYNKSRYIRVYSVELAYRNARDVFISTNLLLAILQARS